MVSPAFSCPERDGASRRRSGAVGFPCRCWSLPFPRGPPGGRAGTQACEGVAPRPRVPALCSGSCASRQSRRRFLLWFSGSQLAGAASVAGRPRSHGVQRPGPGPPSVSNGFTSRQAAPLAPHPGPRPSPPPAPAPPGARGRPSVPRGFPRGVAPRAPAVCLPRGPPASADLALSPAAHGLPGEQRRQGHLRVPRAALLLPALALRLPVSARPWLWAPGDGVGGLASLPAPWVPPRAARTGLPAWVWVSAWGRGQDGDGETFAVSSSGRGLGSWGARGPRSHCEPGRPATTPGT